MPRTNVDVDDEACQVVMDRYRLSTQREAVDYALRLVAGEELDQADARALRGSGWEGDLEEMRQGRSASAWIEFLRDTGSPVCEEVDRLLAGRMATAIRSAWRCWQRRRPMITSES